MYETIEYVNDCKHTFVGGTIQNHCKFIISFMFSDLYYIFPIVYRNKCSQSLTSILCEFGRRHIVVIQ